MGREHNEHTPTAMGLLEELVRRFQAPYFLVGEDYANTLAELHKEDAWKQLPKLADIRRLRDRMKGSITDKDVHFYMVEHIRQMVTAYVIYASKETQPLDVPKAQDYPSFYDSKEPK